MECTAGEGLADRFRRFSARAIVGGAVVVLVGLSLLMLLASGLRLVAPAKRLQFTGFSIIPPQGEGWDAMPTGRARLLFGFDTLFVKTLGPHEFVHAYVVGHRSPTRSVTPQQILNEELERFVRPRGSSLKTSPESSFGASCVRWEMMRESNEDFRGIGANDHEITWTSLHRGYLCSHPDAPAYLVEIGYFDTVPKGIAEPSVKEEGESFLSGLSFTPLGVHVSQSAAGQKPRGIALYREALWVTQEDRGTVSKIDPTTAGTIAEINVGKMPEGLGGGLGSVWVPNWESGTVSRINPASNRVAATIQVGRGATDVAVGFGSVWVTNEKSPSISRIDPAANQVSTTVPTDGRPVAIAAGADGVWVEHFKTDEIWRINPLINRVVATIHVGNGRHVILADRTAVWVTNSTDNTVSKIDPATNRVIATIAVGRVPAGLALAGANLWVANFGEGTISKIDRTTNSVNGASIPVGERPFLLAGNDRTLWALDVWDWENGSLSRIDF